MRRKNSEGEDAYGLPAFAILSEKPISMIIEGRDAPDYCLLSWKGSRPE
jgi:hypothetical protein